MDNTENAAARTLYEALARADRDEFPDDWDDLCESFKATLRAGASAALAGAQAAQPQAAGPADAAIYQSIADNYATTAAQPEVIDVPMAVGSRIYMPGTQKQKILDAAQQRCEMIVRTQQSIEARYNAQVTKDKEWKRNPDDEGNDHE